MSFLYFGLEAFNPIQRNHNHHHQESIVYAKLIKPTSIEPWHALNAYRSLAFTSAFISEIGRSETSWEFRQMCRKQSGWFVSEAYSRCSEVQYRGIRWTLVWSTQVGRRRPNLAMGPDRGAFFQHPKASELRLCTCLFEFVNSVLTTKYSQIVRWLFITSHLI